MDNKNIGFFDFEVFMYDWLVVIKTHSQDKIVIHNNREELLKVMNNFTVLVGFNNYYYDDMILSAILSSKNIIPLEVYNVSKRIITGGRDYKLQSIAKKLPTLDTRQELYPGLSLKEIECNLAMNIKETPISFDLTRNLTAAELEEVIKYCEHDVNTAEIIFNLRKDYFESKLEICNEFNLDKLKIKQTRANLVSEVLKCDRTKLPADAKSNKDRLKFTITNKLRIKNIPKPILNFYKEIREKFEAGESFKKLEKTSFEYNLCDVPATFGFGGMHVARKNFFYEGPMLLVDVGSFYPSMMINENFISRASESPELYKNLYNTRMEYKKAKNLKQIIYKILLNATFGALKSEFNKLYDPVHSNNICINGQLMLTDLIMVLSPYSKLVQANTDGVLIAYKKENREKIIGLCKEWEANYKLNLDYIDVIRIAQRDVNSYIMTEQHGDKTKIKGIGIFKMYEGGNFERNNLTVIDMALKAYYLDDISIDKFLVNLLRENNIVPFQQVAKMGSTFNTMVTTIDNEEVEVQKVNRVFATWKKEYGGIHKIKIVNGVKKYNKVPNSPEHVYIHNDSIDKFDKTLLDLSYYKNLIEKNIFTKKKVIPWELFKK